MGKIRILLIDDHVMLREGVKALLSAQNDIEIIGEASDGREAITKSADLKPDIAILDISMPGMGGLESIEHIKKQSPKTKILILTQHDNKEYVLSAIKAGVAGYVPKRALASELVSAIRMVYLEQPFLYPSATTTLIREFQHQSDKEPYEHLTARQKEILTLMVKGYTCNVIAKQLNLSVKTVQGQVAKLKDVLDLHNHYDLVKLAVRKGLVDINE